MPIYELTRGHKPGYYAVGEGFSLARTNELTKDQAAPLLEAGILRRKPKPKKRKAKRRKAKKRTTKKRTTAPTFPGSFDG